MERALEVAYIAGTNPVGSVAVDAVAATGAHIRRLAPGDLAGELPVDAIVLDGDDPWDALLLEHQEDGVPVLILASGRAPSLSMAEHRRRVVVRSFGAVTGEAVAEAWRVVALAARRRTDRQRAALRDQVQRAVERMPVVLGVTDSRGRIQFLNEAAAALLGEVPVGTSIVEALSTADAASLAAEVGPGLLAAGRWEGTVTLGGRDGVSRAWRASLVAERTPHGEHVGWSAVAWPEPEGASPGPRLVDWVSHEINNALALVTRSVEEARALTVDPAALQALHTALAGAGQLRGFVRELREAPEAAAARGDRVEVGRVVTAILALADTEIRGRSRLRVEVGQLPPVRGSEPWLGQVLLNLVLNGLQAMDPRDFERNELVVRATVLSADEVALEVTDNGRGIAPADLERVFQPFFQRRVGGLGLGLYVVRRAVEGMGGRVELRSTPGEGTTFRVVLRTAGVAAPPPWRARLLLVDDEPMLTKALGRVLGREYEVEVCFSGSQAREILRSGSRFDLLLCDFTMPDGGGGELYEELARTDPELARRILFLTGGAQTREAAAFLERMPERVLYKPADIAFIRQRVEETLRSLGPATPPTLPVC